MKNNIKYTIIDYSLTFLCVLLFIAGILIITSISKDLLKHYFPPSNETQYEENKEIIIK